MACPLRACEYELADIGPGLGRILPGSIGRLRGTEPNNTPLRLDLCHTSSRERQARS
jgi:hypothetical protein